MARPNPERPFDRLGREGIDEDKEGKRRLRAEQVAINHLICPIGEILQKRKSALSQFQFRHEHAGRELAPAFTMAVNRLLWRHRALPSATLDKMRTKLLW